MLGSRAFLDVMYANWYNFFPLRPTRDFGLYDGPWGPGRIETTTSDAVRRRRQLGYQDQKRYKPQVYVSMAYFKDGWKGSHDFKFGYDWKRDRRNLFNDQPFDIFYRDTNSARQSGRPVQHADLADQRRGLQRCLDQRHLEGQRPADVQPRRPFRAVPDGWPEQDFTPNGHSDARQLDRPDLSRLRRARAPSRRGRSPTPPTSRRASDLPTTSPATTARCLKVFFGKFNFNSADELANRENPVGRAQLRYHFLDLNGNRLLDGPSGARPLNSTQGGGGFVRIDRDLIRPTASSCPSTSSVR